ncbi:tRNA pseudouridine(13) synthase TruD [Paludisphaera borealis]|uniref:tRNA pseudouridine synthase D n=1 Tax=Paludisphaera borealis TaxID=1387353 RepID=A0A1U7CVR6_9BACT|nr:tRNA pseudouridine(13) synthase TruD [Paludisphaera borealis]APW63040.1 tRNA pseudouridine synthase D [Paludisphaera borealis]
MKLKRQPEDFQVEELPRVTLAPQGRFTYYKLTKRGLGTLEAIEAIRRHWNLPGRSVSYGGLKDRHAVTVQYLSIFDGPDVSLHQASLELEPLGKLERPYTPQDFTGNRFEIVLRDMTAEAAARAGTQLEALSRDGLPNYFDDQRFGSVGFSGEFIAEAWLKGDHERALRLAFAEPNPFDRPDTKARKATLRECWGDWAAAKAGLDRSSERSIVTYLVDHPTDFRGAFARLRRELRSLYFAAFQSHLWNLVLAGWIERNTRVEQRSPVDLKVGVFPFPVGLDEDQRKAIAAVPLPLPSSRNKPGDGPVDEITTDVLAAFGLTWTDMRVKHLKDVFFSKGSRDPLLVPENVKTEVFKDDLHRNKQAIRLAFELPKGSYATILVKRITEAAGSGS